MWKVLISVSVISAVVAILEVSLFGYMGQLVDWFATRDKSHVYCRRNEQLDMDGAGCHGLFTGASHSSIGANPSISIG